MYEFELNLWKAANQSASLENIIRCRVELARILTDSTGKASVN